MKIHCASLLSWLLVKIGGAQAINCFVGDVTVAGSTTVEPLGQNWAKNYTGQCPGSNITVEGGGSSMGAARVCGDTSKGTPVDIGAMSRDWNPSEAAVQSDGWTFQCLIGNTTREVAQFPVALDGVSVVVKGSSAADQCIKDLGGLTTDQLRWIFSNYTESQLSATGWNSSALKASDGNDSTHKWKELDDRCPDAEILIAGLDPTHGTNEFFRQTILTDYANYENFRSPYHNYTLEEGVYNYVKANSAAIGYLAYGGYAAHADELSAAAIKNSQGKWVLPTLTTIADGTYNPLSRKVYMNLLKDCTSLNRTLLYLDYGYSSAGDKGATAAGLVSLPSSNKTTVDAWINGLRSECGLVA